MWWIEKKGEGGLKWDEIASMWGEERGGERRAEGGGTLRKRHTFRAYLHVAASMTGNLGKFSTEPAADGGGIKTKGESNKREKREGRREGGGTRGEALKGTCADYLTRPELGLRARQQMGFQIPIRGEGWDRRWGRRDGRRRVKQGRKSPCWQSLIILFICSKEEISKALFNSISLFLLRLKDQAEGRNGWGKRKEGKKKKHI